MLNCQSRQEIEREADPSASYGGQGRSARMAEAPVSHVPRLPMGRDGRFSSYGLAIMVPSVWLARKRLCIGY